eukprot:CAMPEP_0202963246 /NCGR_PEP_ID=MMETSP1396-20130829/7229_1 /ASSEMBLY_ACC=CAM_ASM_000872 /TAXON_ID= /ORGANISM="Pseudokeronopsis sp., Strain Brazil" /LENGTH=97 /DNA_ID=CAMNT_0049684291 /DNA_START=682 /DNA_END=975 /DNA_ORIENTATION=-
MLMVHAYFDTKMKVFNSLTQKEITQLDHPSVINKSDPLYSKLAIYREESYKDSSSHFQGQELAQYHYQLVLNMRNKENEKGDAFKLPTAPKKDLQQF